MGSTADRPDVPNAWRAEFEHREVAGVLVLVVGGRLGNRSGPDAERAFSAAIGAANRGIVLDLSRVDYLSGATLRVIERAAGELGRKGRPLVLCGLQEPVRLTLQVSGLLAGTPVEPTFEQALRRASQSVGPS